MAVTLNTTTYKLKSQNKSPKTNIKKVQYGDGYSQTLVSGINYDREEISLTFVPMDSTNSLELEVILLNSPTSLANMLLFTPIGESTTKYYIASSVTNNTVSTDWYQVSCKLERQFPII